MIRPTTEVAAFRFQAFRNYPESDQYLRASDAQRRAQRLHERSLASSDDVVRLSGTCGLCLNPTRFTAPTRGGELAPGGRVPNWREGLACDCKFKLVNRERALLHYVLAMSLVQPWTRVLILGEATASQSVLAGMTDKLESWPGPLDNVLRRAQRPRGGFHLILSVEQLTAQAARRDVLARVADVLAPGGEIVFTAPFAVDTPTTLSTVEGPIDWRILDILSSSGFAAPRVLTYWSEEFGYLGAFNVMIAANSF